MKSIRPGVVNHMNLVVEDLEASKAHFIALFGGEALMDIPPSEFRASLVTAGRVIIELFSPHSFFLNARFGPYHLGLEYQADIEEVRAALADHGVRLAREFAGGGLYACHTHPADTLGVAFEFFDGTFHDQTWPALGGETLRPADYWRDEHPLGLTGLRGYTLAVWDADSACAFLKSFLNAEEVYRGRRPAIGAHAVGMRLGEEIVEVLTVAEPGALEDHMKRQGEGIRSTVFGVRDLEQARRYFSAKRITLVPGAPENGFGLDPAANLGLIFEFAA